jgi:hypothetical protein
MFTLKTLFFIAAIVWYLYSTFKSSDDGTKKKGSPNQNPAPASKGKLEELMERMIQDQQRKIKEKYKTEPLNKPRPAARKISTASKPQDLPFEKRKSNAPREMPSRRQIAKVEAREKKATESPVIVVKDYDENLLNHDKPHTPHHLADKSKIHFNFGGTEETEDTFDVRMAIISQAIFERKEY